MLNLGTFGGSYGTPNSLNNRGQVVGFSNLPGDATSHPFLWDRGVLTDLGTFGGTNGEARWINDAGEVVGTANFPGDQLNDAFLWKNGVMTDLGNLGQTSFAFYTNSKGQVVGHSKINDGTFRAFLWENRGPMIDLNTLIPSGSSLLLVEAFNINDRGEIAGLGLPPGCEDLYTCGHAYVLVPREGDQEDRDEAPTASTQSYPTLASQPAPAATRSRPAPREEVVSPRDRLFRRYRLPHESAGQQR
jgi:probable HAF family extracellular repeat protein